MKTSKYVTTILSVVACFSTVNAALAGKYNGTMAPSREFSSQKPLNERAPLPRQATPMADADLKAAAPVTFDELRLFARDWRKYEQWLKNDGNQYKAVAYLGVSSNPDWPPEVVKWMDEHGWTADRFFLLERKFRITLSVLRQEIRRNNLMENLNIQRKSISDNLSLSPEQRKSMLNNIERSIIEVKNSTAVKAPVTPQEYDLIKLNREALEKILNDR